MSNSARSTRRILLLAIVMAVPVLFSLRVSVMDDPDIWWHLRTGQWIVEHRALPATDPFSSFGAGKPWVAYSWMFDLAAYGLYRACGLVGIVLLQALLALATAVALFVLTRRFTNSLAGLAVTAAGLFAMVPMYAPRPWLLTLLFFIIEVHLLLASFADGRQRRLLWLAPLFALWANVHIQFVYGLLVLGLAAATPAISAIMRRLKGGSVAREAHVESDSFPLLWMLLSACVLATLATPYGWHVYKVVYEYASQPAVFNLVTEFHALAFRTVPDFLVLLLSMAAAAALARLKPAAEDRPAGTHGERAMWFAVLLLATTAILSFRSARDAWCVVVVAVAVLAQAAGRSTARAFTLSRREIALSCVLLLMLATLAARARQLTNTALQRQVASTYPVQAAREVRVRGYSGPLYNHFNWGGYLIWGLPGLPVSMDGRTNVHGDARIAQSVSTWNGDPGWQRDPELKAARLVIAAPHDPLFLNLRQEQRFQLVYQDAVAGVFIAP